MRLRIIHSLSFVLIGTVLLSVVVMGGLSAWQLSNGFQRYLQQQDVRRLDEFAQFVSQQADATGGLDAVAGNQHAVHQLMDQFAEHLGIRPRQAALDDARVPRPPGVTATPNQRLALPDGFAERISVVRADDSYLFGLDLLAGQQAMAARPIRFQGQVVAFARIYTYHNPTPEDLDAAFLNTQYASIALAALLLTLLATAIAWVLAQRDVRALEQAQSAAQQIGSGKFAGELESSRGDEIGDLLRMINGMASNLSADDSRRKRWIADISHELRTPSTVLRGEIDALIDHVRPLDPNAMLSLREEVVRLTHLIDDLHLVALSELSTFPCALADADAVALVRNMANGYTRRAQSAGIVLELKLPQEASMPVRWDARRIEQLLRNLLENSLRYTDAPGRIVIALEADDRQIVLTVDDSAPGVTEAEAEHIFLPLHRTESARARNAEGSGLGLAICQIIAQSHGGSIRASPSELGGIRMQTHLPAHGKESS